VKFFTTFSRRKNSASKKLLAVFLAFFISSSIVPDLAASMVVIEEADYISEILEIKDAPESRDTDVPALISEQSGIIITGLRHYSTRTLDLDFFAGFSPRILPIRGSPLT
jgi:hypothetical protein